MRPAAPPQEEKSAGQQLGEDLGLVPAECHELQAPPKTAPGLQAGDPLETGTIAFYNPPSERSKFASISLNRRYYDIYSDSLAAELKKCHAEKTLVNISYKNSAKVNAKTNEPYRAVSGIE